MTSGEGLPPTQSHEICAESFPGRNFTTLNDKAYDSEISELGNLERFHEEGLELVQMVYSFRSLSKAIPEIVSASILLHYFKLLQCLNLLAYAHFCKWNVFFR
jgi:hypothetical protein